MKFKFEVEVDEVDEVDSSASFTAEELEIMDYCIGWARGEEEKAGRDTPVIERVVMKIRKQRGKV